MRLRQPVLLGTALLSLSALGLWGCKDYLTTAAVPQGTLSQATLSNKIGVEGSLISTYRALDCTSATNGNWGCAASNWVWGSVASDDAYKGSEASDQSPINDIEAYHWSTADAESYLNNKWRQEYEGITRANATLRLLADVQKALPGELTAADARSIRGEAMFLRAHYHFEAWRMWANIPYYREDDANFSKPNLTSAEVVTNIARDLDSAAALLTATPRNGQVGRVTSWTARAYKGRLQAYNGQWAEALTTLRAIRTGGPYALEASYDRVWTGFKEYGNGKETILAYQASSNDGEAGGLNASWGETLNFPHSGSPFGCCGFHQPSQNLVNFFGVDATGLPLALNSASWNARNTNLTAADKATVDPRLDWTVGRDGVPYKDWGPHAPGWIRAPAYGGPYSPKKNVYEKSSGSQSSVGWNATQLSSVNVHIFRYADLLLLLAEAEVEAGSLDNARTIVNEIRARAAVRVQGPGTDRATMAVPIDDPSITWANYRVAQYPSSAFADKESARTRVRYERRLELAMEGQRFFDLKRWNIAVQTLNDYVAAEKSRRLYLAGAEPFTARHLLFPLPAIQIELSKAGGTSPLKQNPGW